MQSGAHGKPLVKLPKTIAKEAQMLSARLLREGAVKHMEILSLDMMNNSLHALYHLGAVHKEKRYVGLYVYQGLINSLPSHPGQVNILTGPTEVDFSCQEICVEYIWKMIIQKHFQGHYKMDK